MTSQIEKDARLLDLAPLLNPKVVAVVGVSSDSLKLGNSILGNIISNGFKGKVYALAREPVQVPSTVTVVRSFEKIPEIVDVVIVAVPAANLLAVLKTIPRSRVQVVVSIASGFSESGEEGRELESALRSHCAAASLLLIGPNCQGVVIVNARLQMTFSPMFNSMVGGSVAVIAQSGALGAYMSNRLMQNGTGIHCFISSGNETCLDSADYINLLAADPGVCVILCYLEQIRSGSRFVSAVQRLPSNKHLVVVKSGRSVAGAEAANTHTGALASDDVVVSGVFKELGIIRPKDSATAVDIATALATGRLLKGRRIGILSIAGGLAVELTDLLELSGFSIPEFAPTIRDRLEAIVPVFGATRNPIDLTGAVLKDSAIFRNSLDVLAQSDVDGFAIISTYLADPSFADSIVAFFESTDKPVIICWTGTVDLTPESLRILAKAKIPLYENTGRAAAVFEALVDHGASRNSVILSSRKLSTDSVFRSPSVRYDINSQLRAWQDSGRLFINEADAKNLLARAGLPLPRRSGYTGKSVIKYCSDTHLHKSDFDLVRLNVEAAKIDFEKDAMRQRAKHVGAKDGEMLVEEMIGDGLIEWFVGCKNDRTFGPVVVVGAGGIFAEFFTVPEIRMAPITFASALELIKMHPAYVAMSGARGRTVADVQELARVICRISEFFVDSRDYISEMDINPIIVRPAGTSGLMDSTVVIADASIKLLRILK